MTTNKARSANVANREATNKVRTAGDTSNMRRPLRQFCYVCPMCGSRVESAVQDPAPTCIARDHADLEVPMRRDWKGEAVGIGPGVRVSRKNSPREQFDTSQPLPKHWRPS